MQSSSQNMLQSAHTHTQMYVINTPMANAVLNNENNDLKQEIQRLSQENEQLRRKLSEKSSECDKLKREIKKSKNDSDQYKVLMRNLNDTIISGGNSSSGSDLSPTVSLSTSSAKQLQKKFQSHMCSCCCQNEKPYICDWLNCGKRFRQKPHLDAHKNIHTGRRFSCDWPNCGKSFVRKYNLTEHRKLHSQVNPNMCEFPNCGKCFSSKYSLSRHQTAQHSQLTERSE